MSAEKSWQVAAPTPAEQDSQLERAYLRGRRAALFHQLGVILTELNFLVAPAGLDDIDDVKRRLGCAAREREEATAALRLACEEYGDNDWEETVAMADVINYHLVQHLVRR